MEHIGDGLKKTLGGRISEKPIGEPDEPGKPCDKCGEWAPAVWCVTRWMLPPFCDDCIIQEHERTKQAERRDRAIQASRGQLQIPKNPGMYQTPPGDMAALNAVSKWKPERMGKWLYLHGKPGGGKTHLATFAIRQHFKGGSAMVSTAELVGLYRGCFDRSSDYSQDEIERTYKRAPILVLDDIGAESLTTFAYETIFAIIDQRITYGQPTILTSNYTIGQLAKRAGDAVGTLAADRLASRLSGQCVSVEVKAGDYRLAAEADNG